MNVLTDEDPIKLFYEASQAGVEIELMIRGICCLRPGVPGVSENIRCASIVGRFLEHTRIFYFANGGDGEIYSGSADMMERNLDQRRRGPLPESLTRRCASRLPTTSWRPIWPTTSRPGC